MRKGLLPHRLNYNWQASASTTVVRSAVSVLPVAIGAVRLLVSIPGAWASVAAAPTWATASEPTDSLCVALRIDALKYLKTKK